MKEIRKKIYLARDGANAASLREKGINYKMILGVPVITLRKIAEKYTPDIELANQLWAEDHRELKILATMIQDSAVFSGSDDWVNNIHNLELAEQAAANLFCKIPHADQFAEKWIQSSVLYIKITGFLLYTRLFMQDYQPGNDFETYFHAVADALNSESLLLKNVALNSLRRLGRRSETLAKEILVRFELSSFYDDLKFEFENSGIFVMN